MGVDPTYIGGVRLLPSWVPATAEPLLRTRDAVVPIVGSGVSRHAGLLDGGQLARWMATLDLADGVDIPGERVDDCLAVADYIVGMDPNKSNELREHVAERLRLRPGEYTITETLAALVHTPARVIVTFNYDLLMEAAAEAAGVAYRSITIEDIDVLQAVIAGAVPDELLIVHIHGSVQHPPSIVLDWRTYHRHLGQAHPRSLLEALARVKTMLFLGLALNEEYFLAWLQQLGFIGIRHVYVCPAATVPTTAVSEYRHGTVIAPFPDGEWTSVDDLAVALFGDLAP